jgi:hypothetical protein
MLTLVAVLVDRSWTPAGSYIIACPYRLVNAYKNGAIAPGATIGFNGTVAYTTNSSLTPWQVTVSGVR